MDEARAHADHAGLAPNDLAMGAITLVGDHNWRRGPKWRAALAFVFGRWRRYEHLGMRLWVSWWRDQPYLIAIREAER